MKIVGLVCVTNENYILISYIYFPIQLFSRGIWNCPYFFNGCVFLVLLVYLFVFL